jgi:DNA-binding NtrC family response regulator
MKKGGSEKTRKTNKMALVVHPDMEVLSRYQAALSEKGYISIVARDLATALLAMTQHYFEIALVSARLQEMGDGWPLAGVLHMVFPNAFVAVMSPTEPDVLSLQSAINYGVREIYREAMPAPEVVNAIVSGTEKPEGKRVRVQ